MRQNKVIKMYTIGEYDVVFVETVDNIITDMNHIHLREQNNKIQEIFKLKSVKQPENGSQTVAQAC